MREVEAKAGYCIGMNDFARCFVILMLIAGLTGCATHRPTPDAAAGDLRPAGVVAATELLPPQSREATFAWTAGPDEGRSCGYQFAPADDDRFTARLEGMHVSHLMHTDGAWVLAGEDDLGEKVTIAYDPPLLVLPAQLTAGEPFAAECDMLVRNLASGTPRDRGTCAVEIELLGQRTIAIAGEATNVYVVRTTRTLDLKLADVTVTITASYQPGVGLVAEDVHRHVKAMGMFENTVEQAREVIER
jgi:hypothetical protein